MLYCADCDAKIPTMPDHIYFEMMPGDLVACYCDECGEERGLERIDLVKERRIEKN